MRNINRKGNPSISPVLTISDVELNVISPVEIDHSLLTKLRYLNLDILILNSTWSISLPYDEILISGTQVATLNVDQPTSILEACINKLESSIISINKRGYDRWACLCSGKCRNGPWLSVFGLKQLFDKKITVFLPNGYTFNVLGKIYGHHCNWDGTYLLDSQSKIHCVCDLTDALSCNLMDSVVDGRIFDPDTVRAK